MAFTKNEKGHSRGVAVQQGIRRQADFFLRKLYKRKKPITSCIEATGYIDYFRCIIMPKYSVLKNKTNSDFSKFVLFPFGGGRGIRTPVGVSPNGFQDFCNVSVLPIFQGNWLTLNYDKNPAFTRLFAVFDRRGIRTAFIFCISTIVELYRCL